MSNVQRAVPTTNLFDFATSELSQDAFLAWLVAAAAREDRLDLRAAGRGFIAWLCRRAHPASDVAIDAIELVHGPILQDQHIDLWFVAKVATEHVAFVIEDKTTTSHHSDQLSEYEKRIAEAGETRGLAKVFIYLKTGFHFERDEEVREREWRVVGLRELVAFLDEHEPTSDIYLDYRSRARRLLAERDAVLAGLWTDADQGVLRHDYAQYELLRKLSQQLRDLQPPCVTTGRSIGGAPWAQLRFCAVPDLYGKKAGELLFHRVDRRADKYYLSTRQYAPLPDDGNARQQKLARLRLYQAHFRAAWADAAGPLKAGKISGDLRGAKESEIGVLFFDETNTVPTVLEHFHRVHHAFVDRIRADGSLGIPQGGASGGT